MHWVVVGAGAAGCVVAARLVRRPDTTVTLLEAGSLSVPGGVRSPSFFDALAEPGWTYPGPAVRGRGLGGSGAVNGMLADGPPVGPMPVEPVGDDELGALDRALLAAAPDATPARLVRRARVRVTAADAYLTPDLAIERRGDADVDVVTTRAGRVAGVRLRSGEVVGAERVVLCAGAIGSPAILLRSRLGGAGVGRGLRNHPGVPLVLPLARPADPHSLAIGAVLRRGDVQVLAVNHLGPQHPDRGMLGVAVLRSAGTGSVSLGPGGDPVVEWSLAPSERAALAQAGRAALALTEHPAFAAVLAGDVEVGDAPAGVFHWAGTTAAAIDGRGAVLGVEGLSVADASTFGELPAANPYLATMARAEELAAGLR